MANTVKITLEAEDKASPALEKMKSTMKGADESVQKMAGSLRLIKWDAIVNLSRQAIQTATAIYNMARSTASAANEIARAAEITGITTEEIQKLQYAAKMCDVSNQELAMGLKFLARNMGDATKATGEARYYFEALGITMEDLQSKSPLPVLLKIADAFAKTEDPAKKVEYAMALLGRTGEGLVPMLNKGSAGIKGFGDEAVRMGTILGDVVVKKGSEAEDQFKRLETRMNALKISAAPVAVAVAEAAMMLFETIASVIKKVGSVIEPVIGLIYKILEALGIAKAEAKATGEEFDLAISHKRYEGAPAKKGGLPPVMTDEMRRQQAELAKERMAKAIEQIKAEEAIEQAHVQTQLTILEQSWKQNLIPEQEYLGRKKDLEESAIQYSIALSAKETNAIVDGYKEVIKWLPVQAEKAKAREEQERALQAVRNENLIKAEKLAQIGIQADTTFLELAKQITIAESEGRLRIMEEEINKQRELNALRVGLGIMRPGQAALEELDATKKITEERIRHLELQKSIEPSAEKQKTLTADILALNIQIEDVEKQRLKLLPEFGAYYEGFKTGLQQYVASLGSAFQQGADLAKNMLSGMQNAVSNFLQSTLDRTKSWKDKLKALFNDLFNSIVKSLSDALSKQLVGGLFGGNTSTSGGGGGQYGWVGQAIGLIGGAIGSIFSSTPSTYSGTGWERNISGGKYMQYTSTADLYHSGKGPGEPPTFYRLLPKFHSGVGPDEVLSVIRKDESVLTPAQMKVLAPAGDFHLNMPISITGTSIDAKTAGKLRDETEKFLIEKLKEYSR